jgi:hypothetical protein
VVDIARGPAGDLFLVDHSGTVLRLQPGPGCPDDDRHEPNDDRQAARPVPWPGPVAGIVCSGDPDWFHVPARAGEWVSARLRFPPGRGDLDLVAAPGMASRSSGPEHAVEDLAVQATGTGGVSFLVEARGKVTNRYTVSFFRCHNDGRDNQDRARPHPLALGADPVKAVHCLGENEWFSFDALAGRTTDVVLESPAEDLALTLWGPDGREVKPERRVDRGGRISLRFTPVRNGPFPRRGLGVRLRRPGRVRAVGVGSAIIARRLLRRLPPSGAGGVDERDHVAVDLAEDDDLVAFLDRGAVVEVGRPLVLVVFEVAVRVVGSLMGSPGSWSGVRCRGCGGGAGPRTRGGWCGTAGRCRATRRGGPPRRHARTARRAAAGWRRAR